MKTIEIEVGNISYQLFQLGCIDAIHWVYSYTSKLNNISIATEIRVDLLSQYEIYVYEAPRKRTNYSGKPYCDILFASEIRIRYSTGIITVNCSHWADKGTESRLDLITQVFSEEIRESFVGLRSKSLINALKAYPYAFNPVTITEYGFDKLCCNISLNLNCVLCERSKEEEWTFSPYLETRRIIYNETNNTMDVEVLTKKGDFWLKPVNPSGLICEELKGTNIHINKPFLLSDKSNPTNKIWCYITPSGIIIGNNIIKSTLKIFKLSFTTCVYFSTGRRVVSIWNTSDGISMCDSRLSSNNIPAFLVVTSIALDGYAESEEENEVDSEKIDYIKSQTSEASKHITQEITTEYAIDKISNLKEMNENSDTQQFLINNISEISKKEYYDGTVFIPINGRHRDNDNRCYTVRNYVLDVKSIYKREEEYAVWAEKHPILSIIWSIISIFINIIKSIFKYLAS